MPAPRTLDNPQSIRAIFFDVGFTLLAPHPSVMEIARTACLSQGVEIDVNCLRQQQKRAEEHLRESSRARPWTWSDENAINATWTSYFTEMLTPCLADQPGRLDACVRETVRAFDDAGNYALYPDVLPCLRALHERDLTLGVISDWGVSLSLILRRHDLIPFFDFAVISAQSRRAKPDPRLFQTALERANAIPDYTLHIGDSYVLDVLGARSVGITPVLLDRRKLYDPAQLDCLVATSLYDLLDWLRIPRPPVSSSPATP
jgi:HAD superfamily hydrolase (TIGR01549 family)